MKESVRAARMRLSLGALQALYAAKDQPLSLEDLFEPFRDSSTVEQHEATSPSSRKWQRSLMDRLINSGLARSGGEKDHYVLSDQRQLSILLADAEKSVGVLAGYVFPSVAEEHAPAPATDEETAAQLLITLIDKISENHGTFNETLNVVADGIKVLVETSKHTNKRLSDLEERWGGTQRVVEAVQTTLKSASTSLGALSTAATASTDATAAMKVVVGRLDHAVALLERIESDDLGKLTRALKAHADEGRTLHEACLDVMSKRDGAT